MSPSLNRREFLGHAAAGGAASSVGVGTVARAAAAGNVLAYGAAGDGTTLDTASIQAAIDAAAQKGGGEVLFPAGTYLTGTLYMKSGVHLHLSSGAVILGSADLADYPVTPCDYPSRTDHYTMRALIWGEGLHDIAITGSGVIDGQGAQFHRNFASRREVVTAAKQFAEEGRYLPHVRYMNRPYLIRFISCRNVRVEGVTLRNAAMWVQHYLDCDFVTLRGLHVYSHVAGNNDMIDVDCCRDVIIADCVGDTSDDAITLKSTGARATENVVISNCIVSSHCNGIKMGTESVGGFKNIVITNCIVRPSSAEEVLAGRAEGLAGIALEIVDGGALENVAISNIVIEGTPSPLFMRLGNRARPARPRDPTPSVGTFRDVSVSNIIVTGASVTGCPFSGIPGHPMENISLTDIRIQFAGGGPADVPDVLELEDRYPECTMFGVLPAYGFFIRHAKNVRLRDVELSCATPDPRPPIVTVNVEGFQQ